MAEEENDEDTPMRTEEESSDSGSGSGSDSEEEQVEWMVTAREKRSTAGNRLTSLIQQEEPDDELELLFQEEDDDAGFEDAEADQSDVQMDSSDDDDDDDQGPAAGADDLEGEKELQRQARAEKLAKKRKLNDGIPKIFKKRVKIDPTASQSPAPRPKKKSERASWIPTAADMPTRASQRGTTKLSKQQLHVQMVDREIKRLKQLENMEKAAAAKDAAKKPAMTQADRLAEAARVEKQNSKSLSRWEEAEQLREEEQRAKLAALSNRQLHGPVITWWSGMAEWIGGRLRQVGKIIVTEEQKEVKSKKRKAAEMEAEPETGVPAASIPNGESSKPDEKMPDTLGPSIAPPSSLPQPPVDTSTSANPSQPTATSVNESAPLDDQRATARPPPSPQPLPATQPAPQSTIVPQHSPPHIVIPPTPTPPPYPAFTLAPPIQPQIPSLDGSMPLPGFGPPRFMPSAATPFAFTPSYPPPPPAKPSTPPPPAIEHATRNCLILSNFDETALKSKDVQTQILFNRKFAKVPKSKITSELCAITSYPAKYRDPSTGLAYCNSYAYREIQRLKRGEYRWSKLVGAYVGQGTYAARGVPERFVKALVKPAQSRPVKGN